MRCNARSGPLFSHLFDSLVGNKVISKIPPLGLQRAPFCPPPSLEGVGRLTPISHNPGRVIWEAERRNPRPRRTQGRSWVGVYFYGQSRGPGPHRAPADQVVGARVSHQCPQLAEEGRHRIGTWLCGQRRLLHGAASAWLCEAAGLPRASQSGQKCCVCRPPRPAPPRALGQAAAACVPRGGFLAARLPTPRSRGQSLHAIGHRRKEDPGSNYTRRSFPLLPLLALGRNHPGAAWMS